MKNDEVFKEIRIDFQSIQISKFYNDRTQTSDRHIYGNDLRKCRLT